MRPRPAILFLLFVVAGCGAVPDSHPPAQVTRSSSRAATGLDRPEVRQCQAELGRTGSHFAPLPDEFFGAGCATSNSVKLDRIGGDAGEFAVTNLGPLACPLANSFAGWARFGVDRAARQIFGAPLARIETMGSYSCRNVAGTARLSAHSRAEAVDVAAFVLEDGRRISVLGGWDASPQERQFLRTIHDSACKRFGTVLGPDYNADHRNHFHLEYGSGSYCR